MAQRRVYLDSADRQAAYRERQATQLARGEMALTILERPTPALLTHIARNLSRQRNDTPAAAVEIITAVLAGLNNDDSRRAAHAALLAASQGE